MKKVFFIVGEDSGDVIAANLIRELKAMHGDEIECLGIGGPLMAEQGFNELLPMSQISVIGIWEIIPELPRLYRLFHAIQEEIEKQKPDILLTVDFPDFNFMLGKSLKKRGKFRGKHVHYVAPSVWAWRPGRAKKVSSFLDAMICLFPMEVRHFAQYKLKTVCVGHPIVETDIDHGDGASFREANEIPETARTLGLFFGSRESEFKHTGHILREAAMLVDDVEKEKLRVIAPTLPKTEYDVQRRLTGFKLPLYISSNPDVKWDAFKACDAAIAVSGTVALELAYAGVPHVIAYKVSPVTYFILKLMVKVRHVHLANILLKGDIVPEFLQHKCTSIEIAKEASALLRSRELRDKQKEKFTELRQILGGNDEKKPSRKAAEFISTALGLSFDAKASETAVVYSDFE